MCILFYVWIVLGMHICDCGHRQQLLQMESDNVNFSVQSTLTQVLQQLWATNLSKREQNKIFRIKEYCSSMVVVVVPASITSFL